MYLLWRDPREDRAQFHRKLRTDVAQQLAALGARGVTINVSDAEVDPAVYFRLPKCIQISARGDQVSQPSLTASQPRIRRDAGDHQVPGPTDVVYVTGSGGSFSQQSAMMLGSEAAL